MPGVAQDESSRSRKQIVGLLTGRAGTPAELAKAIGEDPRSRTFRRALSSMVEDKIMRATGSTSARRYEPTGKPQKIASGYGAALDMGIAGPQGTPGADARADAFARMGAHAAKTTGIIGAGKTKGPKE